MPDRHLCNPVPAGRTSNDIGRRGVLAGLITSGIILCAAAEAPAPQTIVVFGDSQAEGLAAGLRRVSRRLPGIKIQNRTKPGTAISQPENYDWPVAIHEYVRDEPVSIAVLMFGGNDRLPMRPAAGVTVPFRTEIWHDTYRARVAAMLDSLMEKKLRVVWVGDPICREHRYSIDMSYLNEIFRDVLKGKDATYLDIWTAVADANGEYAAYGKTLDGSTARLRLDDGIHFTPSGYDILADRVLRAAVPSPDAAK